MTHLTLIRQLSKAYQAFEKYSASHVRDLGITPTQFDILATLGNQPPMTLITKGTLTGVLERLDAKGLIHRLPNEEDARSYKIGLSQSGKTLFEKVFPGHVEYLKQAFNATTSRDVSEWTKVLKSIELIFK
jgi:DNA-binding MarR family transcriptional regulator